MKLLIVGGVAGGASAAARARRLNEDAEIIMFEKGDYVSFANCGLPYHIGKVIPERDSLMVMTPEKLNGRANIDVRINSEVTSINTQKRIVSVTNSKTGEAYTESYDKLILSTGSSPLRPPIPGADDPDVLILWTIPDMDKIIERVNSGIKNAVVIGGGFIGVEVVENLVELGVQTTLVEMLPQVLPPLDKEMAQPISEIMEFHGVKLFLDNGVTEIKKHDDKSFSIKLKTGETIETDMVIMSAGIRPNSELAKNAGLELNKRGGIVVNKQLQTSDPNIYAIGDVIEVDDLILKKPTMIPLAGPANKQGRIVADNVFGNKLEYRGSQGTSICKIFEKTAAATGLNEKRLKQEGIEYHKFYFAPNSHASYYPGGYMLFIKVLFDKEGKILGAQITGNDGVDKRIDLFATAIRNGLTFDDLEELELAYAPPYGSAKDPINFAGFVGNNILKGNSQVVYPDSIPENSYLLDIREPDEVLCGTIDGATNIPLGKLRKSLDKLPKSKEIVVFCKVGARGYLAELILRSNDFKVKNLSGGYETWKLFNPGPSTCPTLVELETEKAQNAAMNTPKTPIAKLEINACGLQCPGPIIKVKENMEKIRSGEVLYVKASDAGFIKDIPAWCNATGNTLIKVKNERGVIEALIQKGADGPAIIEHPAKSEKSSNKRTTIVLFSNDLDKTMAAFIMASGFATLGHEVSIFCTFWGLNVLRKDNPPSVKKDILSRMFGFMMPRGAKKLALSKMHMMGMGTAMMKHVMKSKNVDSLPDLIEQAQKLGVKLLACEMAMNVMGIKEEELIPNIERVGVANFAALSEKSNATLFI